MEEQAGGGGGGVGWRRLEEEGGGVGWRRLEARAGRAAAPTNPGGGVFACARMCVCLWGGVNPTKRERARKAALSSIYEKRSGTAHGSAHLAESTSLILQAVFKAELGLKMHPKARDHGGGSDVRASLSSPRESDKLH